MKFEKLFRKNIILQKFILLNRRITKNYFVKRHFYKIILFL